MIDSTRTGQIGLRTKQMGAIFNPVSATVLVKGAESAQMRRAPPLRGVRRQRRLFSRVIVWLGSFTML
jgi:hypothetical protein